MHTNVCIDPKTGALSFFENFLFCWNALLIRVSAPVIILKTTCQNTKLYKGIRWYTLIQRLPDGKQKRRDRHAAGNRILPGINSRPGP